MLVWQELAFLGVRMTVTIKDGLYVAWDGETTCAFDVIPIEGDASKFSASPILSDDVVLLEKIM